MKFKVNLILDGKVLDPSEYPDLYIRSKTVDRIVNEIYDKSVNGQREARERKRKSACMKTFPQKTGEKQFPL